MQGSNQRLVVWLSANLFVAMNEIMLRGGDYSVENSHPKWRLLEGHPAIPEACMVFGGELEGVGVTIPSKPAC